MYTLKKYTNLKQFMFINIYNYYSNTNRFNNNASKIVLTMVKYPQPGGEVSPHDKKPECLQHLLSHYEEVTDQDVVDNIRVINNTHPHLWHLWVLLIHPCMKATTVKSQKKHTYLSSQEISERGKCHQQFLNELK